ncbi:MAG TPA: beta-ketoacyl-ACP synthase II [Thermoanaerobaculia bacterium]|nr:beta-ketoacyl-ACP synthase II [Thermoanaerobaculia bacterium]HUM29695.1 beta-ketoacyl-ACP synthase II [Thermoanaerobaculia bacterium]HXK66995.1 beta-ketoacyl-ACP synthase II [Thermoanaerobaculia bacterium]
MTSERVVVTGLGLVTPLGTGVQKTWNALVSGTSGIAPITQFDTTDFPVIIAGEVKDFVTEEWYDPKEARKVDRFVHLAISAAEQAVRDAGLKETPLPGEEVGVVIGSGIGGLSWIEKNRDIVRDKGPRRVSPFFIPGSIVNMPSGIVSILHQFKGPNSATCTACATGAHALGDAYSFIKRGLARAMVSGGTESVICPLALAGFASMRALSSRNEEPQRASRPWDRDRDGFVIAEGAGVMILESLTSANERGAKIYAEVIGTGMSGDAFHMAAPDASGDGAKRAMRAALQDAGISPEDVDYINAHGTSTPVGDIVEIQAVKEVFGSHADELVMNSSKSMIGHTLGAAGGVESAVTVLTLYHGLAHPTVNLENPDEGCDLNLCREGSIQRDFRIGLNNSFGFGGTNACVLFRRWDGS